jgi:hypothetical protein
MSTSSASTSRSREARSGHYAALRWGREDAQLATLLHEAAHGLAHVRKIPDTSRQGRYHNRRYQVLAEELGLDVAEPAYSAGGRPRFGM